MRRYGRRAATLRSFSSTSLTNTISLGIPGIYLRRSLRRSNLRARVPWRGMKQFKSQSQMIPVTIDRWAIFDHFSRLCNLCPWRSFYSSRWSCCWLWNRSICKTIVFFCDQRLKASSSLARASFIAFTCSQTLYPGQIWLASSFDLLFWLFQHPDRQRAHVWFWEIECVSSPQE